MQEINILQNSKPVKFCRQNHMNMHVLAFSENNQSFIPLLIFSFVLQRKESETFHFKRKNTFPRAGSEWNDSLQDRRP